LPFNLGAVIMWKRRIVNHQALLNCSLNSFRSLSLAGIASSCQAGVACGHVYICFHTSRVHHTTTTAFADDGATTQSPQSRHQVSRNKDTHFQSPSPFFLPQKVPHLGKGKAGFIFLSFAIGPTDQPISLFFSFSSKKDDGRRRR